MKNFRKFVVGMLLAVSSSPVAAAPTQTHVMPQMGFWWNPAEPGRGYFIEVQFGTILFGGFFYSASGEATWVASTGTMQSAGVYSGDLVPFSGGQTLGGSFQPATAGPSLGTLSLTFTAANQGIVTWPGGDTTPIQRYDIVPGGSSFHQSWALFDNGWYYDPSAPGRGFALELQGGIIYLAGYMYDAQGNPVWYVATGPFVGELPSDFAGTLVQFSGGQTMTGPYRAPVVANSNVGEVILYGVFANGFNLVLPNGKYEAITRFLFAPIPAPGTWQPVTGVTPATGNYVYLQGQPGDYVIRDTTYTYTQANSVITVQVQPAEPTLDRAAPSLYITATGDKARTGTFEIPQGASLMTTGTYLNLADNTGGATGGLSWGGDARGCTSENNWFAIDNIAYDATGTISALDLRWEQHCSGAPPDPAPGSNGKIHWMSNDPTTPPGPVEPVPANLWSAPASALPTGGDYIYLAGQPYEYVSGAGSTGVTYVYGDYDGSWTLTAKGNFLQVIFNNYLWTGFFQTMNTLNQFEVGYYPNTLRYSVNNPTVGGLDWGGMGNGCNLSTGWFAVDNVVYSAGVLTAIDLRFQQSCFLDIPFDSIPGPALNGQIHWTASGAAEKHKR